MSVLIREVRPWGGPTIDLAVVDGRLTTAAELPPDASVIEGGGRLALPTMVNAHAHPDKTMWGQPWLSRPPTHRLTDVIDYDVSVRQRQQDTVAQRAGALLRAAVASGTRGMRAHVDVAPVYGLSNLTGVRAAAAELATALDVQLVAFPQLGVMRTPGTAAIMRDAMAAGADLVGGLDPWSVDGDADGQLAVLFSLAHEFDTSIDLHLHDEGAGGADMIRALADRAAADGLGGRLTLSHAFALGDVDPPTLTAVIDALLAAQVGLATCAHGDAPLLPLAELQAAGVPVALGTDGIRDPWSPFGTPDLLERVWLQAFLSGVSSDAELVDALMLATSAGDAFLDLAPSGFAVGDPADFMLVAGENAAQVVIDRPVRSLVLRGGTVVARDGHCVVAQVA